MNAARAFTAGAQERQAGRAGACRHNDRERNVTVMPQIEASIDHSPWQINDLFIVLFKRILDPRA
jgi:hypothetical protein